MATTTRYTVIDREILSENRNGVKRDYVPDLLGSTIALIDNTQTQTDTFSYYPYGEVASRTGTTQTPFQYVGTLGYYQDNSGRTYVRARHLRTAHGRWMTQDPIGFDGGDFNLYRYVENMPLTETDPSGLKTCGDPYPGPPVNPKPSPLKPCSGPKPTLLGYGCYCGPDRNPFYNIKPQPPKHRPQPNVPPKPVDNWDGLDGCCVDHDRTYWKWGCKPRIDKRQPCKDADARLCQCIRNNACKGSPTPALCFIAIGVVDALFCTSLSGNPRLGGED